MVQSHSSFLLTSLRRRAFLSLGFPIRGPYSNPWPLFQSVAPIPIRGPYSNPWPLFQSVAPIPIRGSYSNPWLLFQSVAPIPIRGSYSNPWLLLQSVAPTPIRGSYSNPWLLFQSMAPHSAPSYSNPFYSKPSLLCPAIDPSVSSNSFLREAARCRMFSRQSSRASGISGRTDRQIRMMYCA